MSHQKTSAICFTLFSTLSMAQISTNSDSILITADRIYEQQSKISSTVQVISTSQVEKSRAQTFDELLKSTTDLNILTSGSIGNSSALFLRGAESSQTLVILDGIVLNDPSNPNRSFDFSKISLSNIEKIEVLKGSQGLLYGSNAIGGVIVITTKKEIKNGPVSELKFSYGTYETTLMSLSTYQKINNQNLIVGLEHINSDGFSSSKDTTHANDKDGLFKQSYNVGLSGNLNSSTSYEFKSHLILDKFDLDKGGGPNTDDPNYKGKSQELYTKIELNKNWSDYYKTKFFYSYINYSRRSFDQMDAYQTYDGTDYFKGYAHSFNIENNYMINENLTQDFNIGTTNESDFSHSITSFNSFLYNKLDLSKTLQLNLGARIDHHQLFGNHLTYKLGSSKQFENLTIRASLSTGFRAPSLNQLYVKTYGNTKLSPEKSRSYDLGFETKFKNINSITTFFYTYILDRLSYVPSTLVNINAGRAQTKGIEQSFSAQVTNEITDILKLNLTEANDLQTGKRLARRPEFQAGNTASLIQGLHEISLENVFSSSRADVDNNGNRTKVGNFFLTHMTYNYSLNPNSNLNLKIKNVFDSEYQEVWGYNTGGRMITLGYNMKF